MCVCVYVCLSCPMSCGIVESVSSGVLGYVDQTPDLSIQLCVCVFVRVSISDLLDLTPYQIKAMKTIRLILSVSLSVCLSRNLVSLDGWSGWSEWSVYLGVLVMLGYVCTVCLAVE